MQRYRFSEITRENFAALVDLQEAAGATTWTPEVLPLTEEERFFISVIQKMIQGSSIITLNEATVWSKAIYPVLLMVEKQPRAVWSQVEISASFAAFVLEGIADGLIGTQRITHLSTPYFVVIEAKRGVEAKDPQPQLYGAMLAAAKLNWDEKKTQPQTIYGCYTIADSWTFLRGRVEQIETDKPTFYIDASRDFIERVEAETILGILKAIVAENEQ
jgi:hypothetical protein